MNLIKERRGFAAMSQDKQREISSKGGKAAHVKGTAHEFNADEARRAGRLGGEAVSQDRNHMAQIGSRGGQIRGQNAQNRLRTQDAHSAPAPTGAFATAHAQAEGGGAPSIADHAPAAGAALSAAPSL
jgi:hypothetical protein